MFWEGFFCRLYKTKDLEDESGLHLGTVNEGMTIAPSIVGVEFTLRPLNFDGVIGR